VPDCSQDSMPGRCIQVLCRACRLKVLLEWVKFAIGVLYLVHMGFPVYRRYLFGAYTLVCIDAAWAEHSNRWAEELEVDSQGDNSDADSFHSCEA